MHRLVKDKNTYESKLVRDALKSCQSDNLDCSSQLSEALVQAHALNTKKDQRKPHVFICAGSEKHILVLGRNKKCGVTTIGPRILFSAISAYALICTHSSKGSNVGVFAEAELGIGYGEGLTVGASGACLVVNVSGLGAGILAGAAIINEDNFY